MVIFTGQAGTAAVSIGKLRFCLYPPRMLTAFSKRSPEEELVRFRQAQLNCIHYLSQMYKQAVLQIGPGYAHVFMIYAMLVEDSVYVDMVHTYIKTQNMTAEYAVSTTGETFSSAFSALEDEYMRARGEDVRNVGNYLINELIGYRQPEDNMAEPAILVDTEFSPDRILNLDREKTIAVIARRGSISSHAAELARVMKIPMAVQMDLPPILDGHLAVLNGIEGRIYVDPMPEFLEEIAGKQPACL